MTIPAPILALRDRGDDLRDRLTSWAHINSGSHHYAGLERMREALRLAFQPFAGAQIETVVLPGTPAKALRVRCRPEAPRQVMLSGHYDTVFGEDHPFQRCALLDTQTLRGPGVADMKGGLLTMVAALEAFEQLPEAVNVGWEALLTPDEEIGSDASAAVIIETARRHQLGLVFEPARSTGDLVQSRKGTGNFTLTVHGRAAHAGHIPNQGRNAIVALAELLVALQNIPAELPGVLVNAGRIEGGSAALNVVPDFARAGLNLRITRVADEALVRARLQTLLAPFQAREGFSVELTGVFDCPPKECGPAEEAVFAEWQRCGLALGVAPFSWVHTGGGSDGNLLSAAGLPNLDGVGPVGDGMHSDREFCRLPSLVERAQIAALFLSRWARGEISPLPQKT